MRHPRQSRAQRRTQKLAPSKELSAPALERGLALLDCLNRAGTAGLAARELHVALGVPRASLYRLLKPLLERRVAVQDPASGRYRAGPGLVAMGFLARRSSPLVEAAQPLLREVAQLTHRMAELAVTVGPWELTMLDVWQVEGTPVRIMARPGLVFTLNTNTAPGLVYLSFDGARRLKTFLNYAKGKPAPPDFRERRIPPASLNLLEEQCARWRKLGYAWCRQEGAQAQNARVSVPVYDPHAKGGRLAAVLGIACGAEEVDERRAAEWAVVLRAKARALERALAK